MSGRCNRRQVGGQFEQLAEDYLYKQGLTPLQRNYRCKNGELDLVMLDGRYLVFVEVKYRSTNKKGCPMEAVDARKRRRIRQAARYYLYSRHYPDETACRFDVVSILGNQVRWIRDAF